MSEQLTLSTPEVQPAVQTTTYRIVRLLLDWDAPLIQIVLRGQNGESKSFTYGTEGPVDAQAARDLMRGLNTANLSVKSLQRRVLERLSNDGKLVGTVSGTPM